MFYKDGRHAITLIELVVVVVVVGILAGLALPTYTRSRERTMDKQAIAILNFVLAAERVYKSEMGGYYPNGGATESYLSNINSNLRLDLVDDGNWATHSILGIGTSGQPSLHFQATWTRDKGGYSRTWSITDTSINATCAGNCP
ncbi:MAG: type II secretion system protein [Candidatus Omnitrophica bacterium]|nr:type II secretion system protein [Candidatus Omnitrophota bacterium]MDD5352630.1 type II secretion system protein [Candidatus Omnitrophota bacterium]MDD5550229.1 type II secretion system protein [Candidatus Omnitrophota bacterium]